VAIRLTRDPANVSWTAPAEPSGDGALPSDEKRRRASLAAAVQNLNADGADVAIFTVSAVDAQGRAVPLAQNKVNFAIEGAGKILGVGNGDPNCHEPEKGNQRSLFNGLAQIIVQSTRDTGEIKLTASADSLAPSTAVLETKPCTPRPFVP
jgi:beta-galactosidase